MSARATALIDAISFSRDHEKQPVKITVSEALYLRLSESSVRPAEPCCKLFGLPYSVSPHLEGMGWVVELRNGELVVGPMAEGEREARIRRHPWHLYSLASLEAIRDAFGWTNFSIEEPPGTLAGFEAGARYGRSFARRRALAELRALKDQFDNEDAQNDDNATGLTEAWGIVRKRIAEIEAEAE